MSTNFEFSQKPEYAQSLKPSGTAGFVLVFAFTTSMLVSALLLFFIQPMFGKMALPLLGGSSSVWNTAMVFFQAVLLAGYLYAHVLTKLFKLRTQIVIHFTVMAASIVFLPIAIPESWQSVQNTSPTLWLLGLFSVSLGAPFFALSANAPLLQKWFSYTSHKSANDPYFLYAASNLGSLVSLLSYPVLIEPFVGVSNQSLIWAVGFVTLISGIILSGALAWANKSDAMEVESANDLDSTKGIAWQTKVLWIGCAAVPSGLMLAVTAHMTSNIASAPFLWIMPLAIYLFTFIIAFSPKRIIGTNTLNRIFPLLALLTIAVIYVFPPKWQTYEIGLHLISFFLITQMCHNRLADNRPSTEFLTQFYFFMSLGGVLGGATVALAAPVLFTGAHEYVIMIIAAAFLAPGLFAENRNKTRDAIALAAIVVSVAILVSNVVQFEKAVNIAVFVTLGLALICTEVLSKNLSFRKPLLITGIWVMLVGSLSDNGSLIYQDRSFFGILKVKAVELEDGDVLHKFLHGNTVHNSQLNVGKDEAYPLAYYSDENTFGQAIAAKRATGSSMNIAAIGLGAGALACQIEDGENWKFYEIDPLVVEMARDEKLFTYLSECAPDVPIITGDARLTMTGIEKGSLDMIMVDAFSSNTIPAHLVTQEAVQMYYSLLKEDGVIFFHTSNRSLDVASVVLSVAEAEDLDSLYNRFIKTDDLKHSDHILSSEAVVVGSKSALEKTFGNDPNWVKQRPSSWVGVWSDDFSHVVGALMARQADIYGWKD